MRNYVDNFKEFKNAERAGDKNKIKSKQFNKCMSYLLLANQYQYKYASLENGLASQYSMKNNQYPKDLMLVAEIIKTH